MNYNNFLKSKAHVCEFHGFDPIWMPDYLMDFEKSLVEWSIRKGRSAIFADCGLGKTIMQLVWFEYAALLAYDVFSFTFLRTVLSKC